MADFTLTPRSIFDAVGGCRVEVEGFAFDETPTRSLVSLARRRGEAGAALDAAVKAAFGADLPEPGRFTEANGVTIIFSQPGQWLIAAEREELEAEVRSTAAGAGTVTDQSDAFTELTMEGPLAVEVLSRLSSLDYETFEVGQVARTPMQQIAVTIARTGAESWRLNTARSTARDFAHDVDVAAKAIGARGSLAPT
ncbi:MAG: hypothetical protein AAFN79_16955 [Pseudomonadota bacterium]